MGWGPTAAYPYSLSSHWSAASPSRLLYKIRGPTAPLNLEMTSAMTAQLDALSVCVDGVSFSLMFFLSWLVIVDLLGCVVDVP